MTEIIVRYEGYCHRLQRLPDTRERTIRRRMAEWTGIPFRARYQLICVDDGRIVRTVGMDGGHHE